MAGIKNLVDSLEGWMYELSLNGSQMFLFTDNTTVESAFWKGTSKSRKLCDLILRMKCIAMFNDLDLNVMHCSGRRMQNQRTDGAAWTWKDAMKKMRRGHELNMGNGPTTLFFFSAARVCTFCASNGMDGVLQKVVGSNALIGLEYFK